MAPPLQFDFLVIGSGIAGLHFALLTADRGQVAIVTKKRAADAATNYAQGGIAAVTAVEDSFEAHVADTVYAGAGLCDESVVRFVVEHGPGAIEGLLKWGVEFDRASVESKAGRGGYDLGREGGHSQRRILHHRDATGEEIERALKEYGGWVPTLRSRGCRCVARLGRARVLTLAGRQGLAGTPSPGLAHTQARLWESSGSPPRVPPLAVGRYFAENAA